MKNSDLTAVDEKQEPSPVPTASPRGGLSSWKVFLGVLGHGAESRSPFGIVLARNPVTDFSVKHPLLDPISSRGLGQGTDQESSAGWEALGAWPSPWDVGLGRRLPVPVPTQKILVTSSPPEVEPAALQSVSTASPPVLKGPLRTSRGHWQTPLSAPFSLIPPLAWREDALAEG